jgi:peptide/nickel transport system substrate-binding protein
MWIQDSRPEFPTNKKKVRQALTYAINKNEIVEQILMGQGKVIGTAPSMFTWSIEYKPYTPTPYDPEKARKLLAEAGYPKGATIYLYSFVTKLPETKLINEAIGAYWEAIGMKVKILEMDYSAFKPVWTKKQEPRGPAAFILAWPNRPVYSWRNMYHSTALYSHKKDPALDKLIKDFEAETSTEGYIASGQKVMDYVLENFYGTGICTTHELHAIGKNVPQWEMGKGVGSYRWEYVGLE